MGEEVIVRRAYLRGEADKGRSGREWCTAYNLSHMEDLKNTDSCFHNNNLLGFFIFQSMLFSVLLSSEKGGTVRKTISGVDIHHKLHKHF